MSSYTTFPPKLGIDTYLHSTVIHMVIESVVGNQKYFFDINQIVRDGCDRCLPCHPIVHWWNQQHKS